MYDFHQPPMPPPPRRRIVLYYHPQSETKLIAHVQGGLWHEIEIYKGTDGWGLRKPYLGSSAGLRRVVRDEGDLRMRTGTPYDVDYLSG